MKHDVLTMIKHIYINAYSNIFIEEVRMWIRRDYYLVNTIFTIETYKTKKIGGKNRLIVSKVLLSLSYALDQVEKISISVSGLEPFRQDND